MKTALFQTLGCKVNQYETEVLRQLFSAEGYAPCQKGEIPTLAVLNSCTVTGQGDKKTMQQLRKMRRSYPNACIVLCGCFPQAFAAEAASISEADVITGTSSRKILPALVDEYLRTGKQVVRILPHEQNEAFEALNAVDFAERTRAYLKIQDGCQRRCAYCIIPDARGNLRSKPFAETVLELKQLAKMGYLEVVLVGINLSMYGIAEGKNLADVVEAAEEIPGLMRVRLGSLEPDLITPEMLSRMRRCQKLCPQFHIALQSGCDETLKRMRRHYTGAEYRALTKEIRAAFPNAALTTDLMVGFAGETEEEFTQSLSFVKSIGFAKIHVFPYSIRPGTPAAAFDHQVSEQEKGRRSHRMMALGNELRHAFLSAKENTEEEILVEREKDGFLTGHTADYTPVSVPVPQQYNAKRNVLLPVRITGLTEDGCLGTILEQSR